MKIVKDVINSQTIRYYELLEQLVSLITADGPKNVPKIEQLLRELALLFRLCKGVTRLYRNLKEEAEGGGETLCSFNEGEGEPVLTVRTVTGTMSVAKMTVYMKPGVRPLSLEERQRAEVVIRITLLFTLHNRMQGAISSLAFYDDAGYRNLRSLQNKFREMINSGSIHRMAILRYNLRHFSLVSQQLGMATARAVLQTHYLLMEEKVGYEGTVCRLSGDDFIALCQKDRLEKALDFLTETRIPYDESGNNTVTISANAGVFVLPDDFVFTSYLEIQSKVLTPFMTAMSGNNQIVFYDNELARERDKVKHVQQVFADALREEEFFPVYQPKVDTLTGKISGAEALCRWRHDNRIISPKDFIPALEETTDICKLDFYMLERVCRDIRRWIDEDRNVVRISVNLSRKHLLNRNLIADVTSIIDKYQIPRHYIEIEFTETATNTEFNELKRVVTGFRENGICTAIDDFGMGFTSLNLIENIPWNVLKLDRCILPDNQDDYRGKRGVVLRHVVSLVKGLGLVCVAEGVETENQLQLVQETNCDLVQGYYFYRPLSVEDFESRIA